MLPSLYFPSKKNYFLAPRLNLIRFNCFKSSDFSFATISLSTNRLRLDVQRREVKKSITKFRKKFNSHCCFPSFFDNSFAPRYFSYCMQESTALHLSLMHPRGISFHDYSVAFPDMLKLRAIGIAGIYRFSGAVSCPALFVGSLNKSKIWGRKGPLLIP